MRRDRYIRWRAILQRCLVIARFRKAWARGYPWIPHEHIPIDAGYCIDRWSLWMDE